ncbi:MAG: heterodisulfide reductase-related iron-sulfur binding cluster [Gemmatimonadales bacterium]
MAEPASRGGFAALDPCVHCGFCLGACPTYLATGDENASPRGRILLMRALERGELLATDPALREHLDSCLGCRGCEPVCPSGVGYGRGLEEARVRLADANGLGWRLRAALAVFGRRPLWRLTLGLGRWLRATGLPRRLGRRGVGPMGLLAGSAPATGLRAAGTAADPGVGAVATATAETVALFRGCAMDALFDHVHRATRRTLEANGYRVVEVRDQGCCGALHEHAGDRPGAARLARANLAAFDRAEIDWIVVDAAGCGALFKDLGHLLGSESARRVGAKVRDVTELLAMRGPRPGAPLRIRVAYDAPCHLQHAQGVHAEVLQVLAAIPELDLVTLPGSDRCCGSAGLYGVFHPRLSSDVLEAKVSTIAAAEPIPDALATGNPGCLMQIGAGLLARGLATQVVHPVELLDRSYEGAGYYPA